MKKILIGICGIGNGHINRQKSIINALLEYDVQIVLAITQQNYDIFDKLYPQLKKVTIHIPWIVSDNNGLNFEETLGIYRNKGINQFEKFLEFAINVTKIFNNSLPDIIITDYEPNVAQYSYAINKPLICLEQQSKFLYIQSDIIKHISIEEEISRIRYFFPKVDMRFISSFFEIKQNNVSDLKLLPPILKKINRGKTDETKAIVYFSPYSNDVNDFVRILELIKNYNQYYFNIYTNLEFPNYGEHIVFKKIGEQFEKDLYDCKFIISSSGHQLISEAINLEIPLYIFPLKTYEQNYNCSMVEQHNLGKRIISCDENEFNSFLSNINEYTEKMKKHKQLYWKDDWKTLFLKEIKQKYNITTKNTFLKDNKL